MLNNVDLFNECFNHPTNNVDPYNREILNKVIIPSKNDQFCELLVRNNQLINLISEYNNYNIKGDKSHNAEIINKIDECLKYDGMNYSPFSQYLMIFDVNYNMYLNCLNTDEKEYLINSYIKDRHQIYLNREYSEIIFQVLSDNYSHKRKGNLGVRKLSKICEEFGLKKLNSKEHMNDKCYYLLSDKTGKELFNLVIKNNQIDYDFGKNHQGKMPDMLIKYKNVFVIIEHKTSKELGGGQDKQMTEIIDFISYKVRGVYFVSYLDGILFNELKNPRTTNKLYRDKENIINNLKNCEFNYFVNDYGFKKLINYIVNK